ncbi:MAG TPA: ATP-binding protein [Ramlibacter sp.]|nr:ATP-binding protein [Ramlibacter sp.]
MSSTTTPLMQPRARRLASPALSGRGPRLLLHVAFALCAVLLALLAATAHRQAQLGRDTASAAENLQALVGELHSARLQFTLMEAAQWRYLLWGDGADLLQRDAAAAEFAASMARAGKLVSGQPEQVARLRDLASLGERRVALARDIAQRRARQGFDRPWPFEGSAAAVEMGREVAAVAEATLRHERAALDTRQDAQQRNLERTFMALRLAALAALLVLLPAYALAVHLGRRHAQAEQRMADVVEHLPVATWQIRSTPGRGRRFAYVQSGVERLRGFTADQARADLDVVLGSIVDEDRPGVIAVMDEAEQSLRSYDLRYRVRHPDGKVRWIHSSAALRREEDGTIVWSGYWEDITRERELEDALKATNAQLAAANRELEAFSYSVSHDLRAPLAAVDGFSAALAERLPPDADARTRHLLARIRAGAAQMGQLIDALLALAQLGRSPLERGAVDVTALVQQLLAELAEREPARQVRVEVAQGLCARADPSLLRQLYANVLSNAWKFTRDRLDARIEVGLRTTADGEQEFYVADNGAGFDAASASKLFEPFQRYHSGAQFPGSGVGLATVRRIAERHGGRVSIESEVGAGTRVAFTLAPGPD